MTSLVKIRKKMKDEWNFFERKKVCLKNMRIFKILYMPFGFCIHLIFIIFYFLLNYFIFVRFVHQDIAKQREENISWLENVLLCRVTLRGKDCTHALKKSLGMLSRVSKVIERQQRKNVFAVRIVNCSNLFVARKPYFNSLITIL